MGIIQPNVRPSTSNPTPMGILAGFQWSLPKIVPTDGGPEIPEPLPTPKPKPKPKPSPSPSPSPSPTPPKQKGKIGFQPTSADKPNQGGGWGNPLSNNNGANASRGGLQGRGTAGWTRATPKLGYETSGQYGGYNPGRGVSGGGGAAIFPGEPAGDSQRYSLW